MSDDRKIFSRKAMELVDEILGYEVEIDRLADENARLKELNWEMVEVINGLLTGDCERYEFVVKGRAILAKAWEEGE